MLQNCHLAPSFMPRLEKILENIPDDINKVSLFYYDYILNKLSNKLQEFRIWLTSMPSDVFPPSILMRGIKMTYEPPRGLKNNLLRNYGSFKN